MCTVKDKKNYIHVKKYKLFTRVGPVLKKTISRST